MDFSTTNSAAWATAFVMTLLVEVPVMVAVAKVREDVDRAVPVWLLVVAALCCSAVTHPLLWFVWRRLIADYGLFVVSGEAMVVCLETLILFGVARPMTLRRAALVSLVANVASWAVGSLLR
jgi:hypothetical protein